MLRKVHQPRNLFAAGGFAAALVLLVFGSVSIAVGIAGRAEVRASLAAENIVGTPDSSIAGQQVDTGAEAKAFARVMREHALAASGGLTYSELPRYLDVNGEPTNDAALAARDPLGEPVANPVRQLWVTQTALSTALNTAYFAEQVGLFAIVMGVALLLTGGGFGVLAYAAILRPGDTRALAFAGSRASVLPGAK